MIQIMTRYHFMYYNYVLYYIVRGEQIMRLFWPTDSVICCAIVLVMNGIASVIYILHAGCMYPQMLTEIDTFY